MIRYDHPFRVRYRDIDQMGIMYYSRYFEHFEAARTDLMRALGLTYRSLEEQGIYMPVVHAEARYLAGPGFDDALKVVTEIRSIERSRMRIHYRMTALDDDGPDYALGQTVHAFVGERGRPVRIPAHLNALLEQKWGMDLSV